MGKESDVIVADKQFSNQDQHMTNIRQNDDEQVVNKGNKGKKLKVTPDDYGVLNSEDDLDPDNQSMDDSDEDADDIMTHVDQVICLNARRINTKGSLERLQTIKKLHQLSIIAILEPFGNNSHINTVRSQLQMDYAVSNDNGKIWLFCTNEVIGSIMETHDQHITITFHHTDMSKKFIMSFIYAKCKEYMRRSLWDRLMFYANTELPWCTIGDFNVITSIEEKLGGIPYNMNKSFEFIGVIEACELTDL
ncbi:hypothetical protein MTR67_039025 [Solanum verrucosum]|uniref:Uncharacterized protein n=1 Tax=Solanum verrucosum TaxID=315347 RepID=A0AAF0UG66_SOLVR|nr:hypothetical protein MTR67_039025 [Solanum verrucosum]